MIFKTTAAKAGAAGTLVTAGGGIATYAAWDHITLYELEREVLEKDLKFTVEVSTNTVGESNNKTVTIKAEPKSGHTWSCIITVPQADADDLAGKIRDNLPINDSRVEYWDKTKQQEVRNLLVRACAKKRSEEEKNDKSIKGTLTLIKTASDYELKDYPKLSALFKSSLNKVEREVIEKDVKLKVENASNKPKVTVEASSSGTEPKLSDGTSWSCEITLDPEDSSKSGEVVNSLKSHLYHSEASGGSSISDLQRNNKELLVRACSNGSSGNTVTGTLTLKKGATKYDSFKDHPELNHLLTTLTLSN